VKRAKGKKAKGFYRPFKYRHQWLLGWCLGAGAVNCGRLDAAIETAYKLGDDGAADAVRDGYAAGCDAFDGAKAYSYGNALKVKATP
jgi:hypothetical protein